MSSENRDRLYSELADNIIVVCKNKPLKDVVALLVVLVINMITIMVDEGKVDKQKVISKIRNYW